MKAVTFSYDDGVAQDKRLLSVFRRYGMRGTFNLNSGLMKEGCGWTEPQRGLFIEHLPLLPSVPLYDGMEIAVHTVNHPDLLTVSDAEAMREIVDDKAALEAAFGRETVGMAYPMGTYNAALSDIVRKAGIAYARTVESTHDFELPENPLAWAMTCAHDDAALFDLAERFLALTPDRPQVFSVWGHSYQFDVDDNWERLESLCAMLAGHDDIFYATNREVLAI